jgi:crotonobetainyl-CoA:carnitine CoA-transferase CaiB-like acyl-CoA transferase
VFLTGVRVLEFSVAWAGPLTGRFLADFGAEVIHIERATSRGTGHIGIDPAVVAADIAGWEWGKLPGPIFRSGIYPDADPGEHPWNRQGIFNKMHRNKQSLCIDLKTPRGREVFVDLVRVSDIVLNNYSPRGVASLGLDYEQLSEYNPRIITISMSGYGLTGPDSMRVSLGPVLEAHSGLASATGYADGGPLKMGVAFADPIAALHALAATLAALDQRDQTGVGMGLDFSQFEAYASLGGELYLEASVTGAAPPRRGNRAPDAAPQGVYECAGEDSWLAVSVPSDEEWQALAAVLGGEMTSPRYQSLAGRLRHHDEIDRVLGAWSVKRDKFAAMTELQGSGVRAVAVMTSRDLVEGEHLAARGFMAEWDQAEVGRRRFPGFPIHFEDLPATRMEGTAALGAHNESILGEILGYPADRIQALIDSGVLATGPPEQP